MKKAVSVLVNDIHLDKSNGEFVKDIFRQLVTLCRKKGCSRVFEG